MRRHGLRQARWTWALALSPLVFAFAPVRHLVEGTMALHMLLQLPWLAASGWAASRLLERCFGPLHALDAMDAHGLLGLTVASCVLAFWMVPAALDLAVLADPMRWAKYVSVWLSGALLARGWDHLAGETASFFAGNLAWMLATAGLLYQSEPQRLCVNYLVDDQAWTGVGLVTAGLVLGVAAAWRVALAPSRQARSGRNSAIANKASP